MSTPVAPLEATSTDVAEPRKRGPAVDPRLAAWTAVLMVASFTLALANAGRLVATGVQSEWNVLFDADPNVYSLNFSTGRSIGTWGGRSIFHPNLTNFVHVPIRVIAFVVAHLFPALGPERGICDVLAFLTNPFVAALRVPVFVLLFRGLGVGTGWALGMAALDTVSFSTRLFAGIPESYLISGTLIALLFWLGVRTASSPRQPGGASWVPALYLAIGAATLNLVPATAILGITLWQRMPGRATVIRTVKWLSAALALNVLTYAVLQLLTSRDLMFSATHHLSDAWEPGLIRALWDYPRALANGIMPPFPGLELDPDAQNHHRVLLTLERGHVGIADVDPRTVLVLALVALGAAAWRWLPRGNRAVHAGALATLALGAMVHGFFGKEQVLYMQHWLPATLVLMSGVYYLPRPSKRVLGVGLLVFLVAVTVNNWFVMREVFALLEAP